MMSSFIPRSQDQIAQLQIGAFKKIYEILHKLHNNPLKKDFLEDKKEKKYEELYVDLVNHSQLNKEGHTAKAWSLALIHYEDYTSNNDTLVKELVEFIKKRNSKIFSFSFRALDENTIRKKIIEELDEGVLIESNSPSPKKKS